MEYLSDTNGRPAPQSDENTETEPESQNNYVHDLRGDNGGGEEEGKLTLEGQIAMLQTKLLAEQKRVNALELALEDFAELALDDLEAPDVLVPRVTVDMDVSALKAEAWERGWAAPDSTTKEDLLDFLHAGSLCISAFKQMSYRELSDLEGSRSEQKRSAADIFLQHGLEFNHVDEMFANLVTVSKEFRQYCQRSLEAHCKRFSPALLESIAKSPAGGLTFGRSLRFMIPRPAPGQVVGKPWPWLQVADLSDIDVLIQIEDGYKGSGFGNVLSHAVATLRYDADSRQLYVNAECKHFDFEVPIPSPDHEDVAFNYLPTDNPSPQLKALQLACFGQKCKLCESSASCNNRAYQLFARVFFRHKVNGRMTMVLSCPQPFVHYGEMGNYVISFANGLPSPWIVDFRLYLHLYSDVMNEGTGYVKFSTRPFPHSPSDNRNHFLPPIALQERSTETTNLFFAMGIMPSLDASSLGDDLLNSKGPLGVLRNIMLWG